MTRKKSALAAVASAALVLAAVMALLSPARALTNCSVSGEDQAVDAEEQQMLVLVNEYRQANGRNPLSLSPDVTRAAAWFSRDMATKDYFANDHVDSLGRDVPTRLSQCDVSFVQYAENIAAGNDSAEETFEQWRNSPTHDANMVLPGVTLAGIARAFNQASTFGWYWTLDLTAPGSTTTSSSTSSTTSTTLGTPTSTTTSTSSTLPGTPTTSIVFPLLPIAFPTLPTSTTIPTGTTVPPSTTTTSSTSTTVALPPSTTVPLPSRSAVCAQLAEIRATLEASIDANFDEVESVIRREFSGAQEEAILALLAQHRASGLAPLDAFDAICDF